MADETHSSLQAGRPGAGAGWVQTRRVTFLLLAVWGGATFGSLFFARELTGVTLFGWPVSFYMAALGLPLLYLLIIVVYAWRMRRLEHHHVEREQ